MLKSTHKAEVVPVILQQHPNADSLSIVQIYNYQVCVRTEDWQGKGKGIYVVPDSVVNTELPQFAFLADGKSNEVRIKAKKLRGIVSFGLLLPAPDEAQLGDNWAEQLKVTRYEPPTPATTGGDCITAPNGYFPDYDVDALQRYGHLFEDGEPVHATEKIHGTSFRCVFLDDADGIDGEFFVGSRNTWKKRDPNSAYWKAFLQSEETQDFCRRNPGLAVYGEVYGWVQDLRYGAKPGQVWLAVFDILRGNTWVDAVEANDLGADLPWVPIVAQIPYNFNQLMRLSNGKTLIPGADNIREGIVVKPLHERTHPEIGRVQLKLVSSDYLAR